MEDVFTSGLVGECPQLVPNSLPPLGGSAVGASQVFSELLGVKRRKLLEYSDQRINLILLKGNCLRHRAGVCCVRMDFVDEK
jgi:hypothetical protein